MRLILSAVLSLLLMPTLHAAETLRMATTTSTENSGLLARLLPVYERANGISIHVIAVGTGKALEMGRRGDVDVLMVHARNAELEFVDGGYGIDRREFMYNDFLLVGPAADPAGIRGGKDVAAALRAIRSSGATFVSRGDDSGTHKRELSLWKIAGIQAGGDGYREVGQGMGRTLQMADEMQGYTLIDRGTWLASKDKVSLLPVVEGGKDLRNVYGVIAINPARYSDANYAAARQFIEWLQGRQATDIIAGYRIDGQQLFTPLAAPEQLAVPVEAPIPATAGPDGNS
jgi:tungstate transport system substrate-binding protein